jgi:hypothetical protein
MKKMKPYISQTSIRYACIVVLAILLVPATLSAQDDNPLARSFDGKYGQVEIGGRYVGAEFHHSLPFPSRVSFYYPVANSIDLSSDYWQRGNQSHPFTVFLTIDGVPEAIGRKPAPYTWTPYSARFTLDGTGYGGAVTYRFADDLPFMAAIIEIENTDDTERTFELFINIDTPLRTSHTFRMIHSARVAAYDDTGYLAYFDDHDADSTTVFILNAGATPLLWNAAGHSTGDVGAVEPTPNPRAGFSYRAVLDPGEKMDVVLLIGSCRFDETEETVERALIEWESRVTAFEQRITDYLSDSPGVSVGDEWLEHTLNWSKSLLFSNSHYLDGYYLPMPCPAEYNFYFTHDVLLTDLGIVHFDPDRVRNDLLYLISLTQEDSVLAHAYYWKDGSYMTEYAGPENWNHLWFTILTASYLKHSNDLETVERLYPVLRKSIEVVLRNREGYLMYSMQPDWWDIGDVYGARAYLTILTVHALRAYGYIAHRVNAGDTDIRYYTDLASRMREELIGTFWDVDREFLMSMLDRETWDHHYYAGSLLAAAFDLIDSDKKELLLETARRELLDENVGIRIAMPADFHELIDVYQFQGMEAGAPYVYANGGVWPHGTVWYILGLISAGKPDEALDALKRYLTIDGIAESPGGQPSFYEYRNADRESIYYGRIDKPTFLWAGGWFTHALYRLMGVRENRWNIYFSPKLPADFGHIEYTTYINGQKIAVAYAGEGNYFKRIEFDGNIGYTAIPYEPVSSIHFERGDPAYPYLAEVDAELTDLYYDGSQKRMTVTVAGIAETSAELKIVSPYPEVVVQREGTDAVVQAGLRVSGNAYEFAVPVTFPNATLTITFTFK